MNNNKPYIEIPLPDTHEEWLEHRKKFIGGSDCASALGLSPYKSPIYLWCEKTKRITEEVDNESMRIGRDLEDYVAQRFCEATGKKVRKSKYSFQSKEHPFMHANVDRLIVGEDAGLECKTASALTKTKYDKGDIPIQYYLQCMHYMAVTGKKKWYIAVLVMGKGFYHFEVNRDESEIELLIDGEEVFWSYVTQDKMPPVDDTDSTKDALLKMYPQAESNFKKDLFDKDDMLDRYNELKSLEKKIKKEITEIENNLKKDLGECDTGSTVKYRVNWKNTSSMRVDQEELKKKYPNIYNECLKESKTRRFTVKENNTEE